jgi:hypothetical protein
MQKLQFLDKLLEDEDEAVGQKPDYDELSYSIPRIWEHLYNLPIEEKEPDKGSALFFNCGYYQFYVSEWDKSENRIRVSVSKQRIDSMYATFTIDFNFPAKQIATAFYGLMKKLDERKDKMQKLVKAFEKLDVKAKIATQYGYREMQVRDANLDLGRNGHEHKLLAEVSISDLRKNAGEKLQFDISTWFGQPRHNSLETVDEVIQFFKDEQEAGFYR